MNIDIENEFINGKIIKRKIEEFCKIEDPTVYDLRDWFVALHFIRHKSISAKRKFSINKKIIPYMTKYVVAVLKYAANHPEANIFVDDFVCEHAKLLFFNVCPFNERCGFYILLKKFDGVDNEEYSIANVFTPADTQNTTAYPVSKNIICSKQLINEYFTALYKAIPDDVKCYLALQNIILGENKND